LLFASIPIGFLATNLMIWAVPPLREFFVRESRKREGRSFKAATLGLLKVVGIGVPLLFAFSLYAATRQARERRNNLIQIHL